jgi:hypothetical protein
VGKRIPDRVVQRESSRFQAQTAFLPGHGSEYKTLTCCLGNKEGVAIIPFTRVTS